MLVVVFSSTAAAGPAAEVAAEAELVSRYLNGPVVSVEDLAEEAAAHAAATAPAVGIRPTLAVRQEVARGRAGATTKAIGGGAALDLGLSAWAARQAAHVRADAAAPLHRSHRLEAVCGIRAEALGLWAADAHAVTHTTALSRMEAMLAVVGELAAAGERAAYERERLSLVVQVHRTAAADAAGAAGEQRARMAALLGGPVGAVALLERAPMPVTETWEEQVQQHPLLVALRLERDAVAREVAAARREAVPELSISGGARWDTPPSGGPPASGYEVGAALALPDVASVRRAVRSAEAALAAAEARLAQETAAIAAAAAGAGQRLQALAAVPVPVVPAGLWETSRQRYRTGESSLEEIVLVAADLAAAENAVTDQVRLARQARLDLSCAIGHFDEPEIQSVFEDDTP